MRPWPVFQVLIAMLFLGAAAASLQWILAGPNAADPSPATETPNPDEPSELETFLYVESSEPVEIEKILWGDQVLTTEVLSSTAQTAAARGSPESLRILGQARKDLLPLAIRIELETDGQPTREEIHWIRRPEFTITSSNPAR